VPTRYSYEESPERCCFALAPFRLFFNHELRGIKAAFDPRGVLNPGKVLVGD